MSKEFATKQLATENEYSSCLSTFFFGNKKDALEVCDTEPFPLPLKEKATNMGYGIWLITAIRVNFESEETFMNATTMAGAKTLKGCRICLIALPCAKQRSRNIIGIRSDLSSSSKVPPKQLHVELPTPMANLFRLLPAVEQLPYCNTKVEANTKLLSSLKLELQAQPNHAYRQNLQQIAKPIAHKFTFLKPSLEKQFSNYESWKSHLLIRIVVFLLNTALHLGLTFALHRYMKLHKFLPFTHKLDQQKNTLN